MARKKQIKPNPVGDDERFYQSTSKLLQKDGGRTKGLTLRTDDERKGTLPTVSKYPDLLDIYALIDSVTKQQIRAYSKTTSYAILSRDLLFGFVQDWGELNRDHSGYLSQVPENYDAFEASMIGDLLYWMITGVNERSKMKSGTEIRDSDSWSSEIRKQCPNFTKRIDSMPGLVIHDLKGLQLRILNNLPINSYNRYTIAQMTQDDPETSEQIYPSIEPLTSEEHQSLITLKALIEQGDIEKFSVALTQASDSKFAGDASLVFEAYEMAKTAVGSYQRGEIEQARMRLASLENEYRMNMDSFQSGLKDMFVITASTLEFSGQQTGNNKNSGQKIYLKGSPQPLLVSLDTSMPPTREGWAKANMHAAMKAANQANIKIKQTGDNNKKRLKIEMDSRNKSGTLGLHPVKAGDETVLTTNWTGIIDAAYTGRNLNLSKDIKELKDGISIDWGNNKAISLRFIIHANLSEGIGDDYLVPKGRLTIVARPTKKQDAQAGNSFNLAKFGDLFLPKIDLFVEDLGRASGIADAYTRSSKNQVLEAKIESDDETFGEAFSGLDIATDRGKVSRNQPSSKRASRGKAIAIDLVPRSQINMRSITEKNPNLAYLKKIRDQLGIQELYKHYGTGQEPVNRKGQYKWKGKIYPTKAKVMEAVNKLGTQVDKGNPKMQILYGRRKDNNNLVPHRIILPRMMIQHDKATGKLSAKKGSKHSRETAKLLKRLESDFGEIKLKKELTDLGGQTFKDAVLKSKGKKKDINYNRGVSKLFECSGLDSGPTNKNTPVYVSQVALNGVMYYSGRVPGGQIIGPFALTTAEVAA